MVQRGDTQAEPPDPDATVPARAAVDWDATAAMTPAPAAAEPPDPLVGGPPFAGRFEILGKLGRGGMGAVYHARDRQVNGREVALKVLLERYSRDAQFRELFFQEIHAAQKFVSEHVVQVRDTGQSPDGTLFLTMDLVPGESLRSLIDREHALNPRHALEIARQVLLGLQSGHEHGFVHRDVKPSNVMLAARVPKTDANPYGIGVRVLDFGIAGLAAQLDPYTLTGTPKYMSPEQVQAQRLDARSDLFAVGVMLYEMIAGARPFEGETLEEITTSVIETDVAPMIQRMEELSPPVRKILQRALQKDREKRFQNAAEFIRAIERSRAFKIPRVVPVWALAVLLLSLVGNGVQTKLMRDVSRSETTLRERLLSASGDQALAVSQAVKAKEDEIARLQDLLAARDAATSEKAVAEYSVADLSRELDEQKRQRERDREEARQKELLMEQKYQQLQQQYVAVQHEQENLKDQLDAATRRETVEGRMASAFDDMVDAARRGSGHSAKALFVALQPKGVFDQPNLHGRSFVVALVDAAEQLHAIRIARAGGERPEAARLTAVERSIADAEAELPELERQGRSWLGFTPRPQDTAPDRMVAAREALAAMASELAGLRTALAGSEVDRWAEIEAGGWLQEPTAVLAYAKEHGPARASAFLVALAAEVERTCVVAGALDESKLALLSVLDAWDGALRQSPQGFDTGAAAAVRLFATARRVHLGVEGDALDWSAHPLPSVAARTRDWRAEVRLLDETWRRGALWPVAGRARAVHFNPRSDGPRWRDTRLEGEDAAGWSARYELYDADGRVLREWRTARWERSGRQVRRVAPAPSAPWASLTLGKAVLGIEPLPPLPTTLPPKQLWVSEADHRAFVEEYQASTEPCIVIEGPESTLWFSRTYGFVREEPHASDGQAWILAYAPPAR